MSIKYFVIDFSNKQQHVQQQVTTSDDDEQDSMKELYLDHSDVMIWQDSLLQQIGEFANFSAHWHTLCILDVSYNKLSILPMQLCKQLVSLHTLLLSYNLFTCLPLELRHLFAPQFVPKHTKSSTMSGKLVKLEAQGNAFTDDKLMSMCNATGTATLSQPLYVYLEKRAQQLEQVQIPPPFQTEMVFSAIRGCLFGHAIGDSVGMLAEYMEVDQVAQTYGKFVQQDAHQLHFGLRHEHVLKDEHRSRWLSGDFTDDTDMLILVMDSLAENGQANAKDLARRLQHWAFHGFVEFGDTSGKGIGSWISKIVKQTNYTDDPIATAETELKNKPKKASSNGALCRSAVIGLFHFSSIYQVIQNTVTLCKVTHADLRCIMTCVALSTGIALLVQCKSRDEPIIYQEWLQQVLEQTENMIHDEISNNEWKLKLVGAENGDQLIHELRYYCSEIKSLQELNLDEPSMMGYTFKCLAVSFWALQQVMALQQTHTNTSAIVEHVLTEIIFAGGDTDTNGCASMAIVGCFVGFENLPSAWVNGLLYKDWLSTKVERFIQVML